MTVEKVTTAKSFADLYADGRACLPGADLPDFAALRDAAGLELAPQAGIQIPNAELTNI